MKIEQTDSNFFDYIKSAYNTFPGDKQFIIKALKAISDNNDLNVKQSEIISILIEEVNKGIVKLEDIEYPAIEIQQYILEYLLEDYH